MGTEVIVDNASLSKELNYKHNIGNNYCNIIMYGYMLSWAHLFMSTCQEGSKTDLLENKP